MINRALQSGLNAYLILYLDEVVVSAAGEELLPLLAPVDAGLAFKSMADNSKLLKAHVPTSKICLLLLLNLLQIC